MDLIHFPVGHSKEGILQQETFPIFTFWLRPFRYDLNQSKATSFTPSIFSMRSNKMLCLIRSKAALRSRKIKITAFPSSISQRTSFWILRRVISVLWYCLYADWRTSCRLLSVMYLLSCAANTLSSVNRCLSNLCVDDLS